MKHHVSMHVLDVKIIIGHVRLIFVHILIPTKPSMVQSKLLALNAHVNNRIVVVEILPMFIDLGYNENGVMDVGVDKLLLSVLLGIAAVSWICI